MAVFFLGSIGSMMMVYSVPYAAETIPVKVGAFTIFSAIMGITLAPLIGIAGGLANCSIVPRALKNPMYRERAHSRRA